VPPPNPAPGSPRNWLTRVRGHLALAKLPLPPEGFWEDLCFHAQQAAELAIKAVFQHFGWRFAFVHDLQRLLNDLAAQGLAIPAAVQQADRLSVFAAQARYPGLTAVVTQVQYQDAVQIAEAVLNWADSLIP
jgi:HEPN domain-containing protein